MAIKQPPHLTEEKVRNNRLLFIDDAIRSGRYPNATKLAKDWEVNVRTIWRDIEYLRDTYLAPIEYDAAKHGYYYTDPNFFIKSVMLTEGELFSVALFDQLLEQYRNTPLEENLRTIFKKIITSLPDKIIIQSNFVTSRTTFIPDSAPDINPDVFGTLFSALRDNTTVSFDYRSLSSMDYLRYTVDPYHAVYHRGNWFMLGYCHHYKEIIIFSFARMKNAEATNLHFAIPSDFKASDYFDEEMGIWVSDRTPYTVELLFERSIGTFAQELRWNKTQKVVQNTDGSVSVSFTTTQITEVLFRVLGHGSAVTVLNPPELVERVMAEIEKMRGKYT